MGVALGGSDVFKEQIVDGLIVVTLEDKPCLQAVFHGNIFNVDVVGFRQTAGSVGIN